MIETAPINDPSLGGNDQPQRKGLGKTFYTHLAGKTNGAHKDVVAYLESIGKVEVNSCAESDFLVVFCPVVSRVGTDIEAALSDNSVLTDGKPTVLVVMHHTFDPSHVVAASRRQVRDPRVWLTVDCLFYQDQLLQCPLNDAMRKQLRDFLGFSFGPQGPTWKKIPIKCLLGKTFYAHLAGKTNGAHKDVVAYLESIGTVEWKSCAESDFLVVFCPVVSRVGTDIESALSDNSVLTDGKPTVLVVMHHTFDPSHVVAASRRQVSDPRVRLTVDCLFYQDHLLQCPLNNDMRTQVADLLGSQTLKSTNRSQVFFLKRLPNKFWYVVGVCLAGLLVLLVVIVYLLSKK